MQFHKLLYILFVLVDPLLNQTLQYVSVLFAAVVEGIVTDYHCTNCLVRLTGCTQRSMCRVQQIPPVTSRRHSVINYQIKQA